MKTQQFITKEIREDIFDILNQVVTKDSPARIPLNLYIREKRYNSKTRRAVSDFFYDCVRFWGEFKKDHQAFSASRSKELFLKSKVTPDLLVNMCGFDKKIAHKIIDSMDDPQQFLLFYDRAPMSIRINNLNVSRDTLFDRLGKSHDILSTKLSPFGITFENHINVRDLREFKQGLFEIQDEGSQLISQVMPIGSNDKVLDYCAGTGGKSLAIYARMLGRAQVDAYDISTSRLKQLKLRSDKLGTKIRVIESPADNFYDSVLVDAPCSGLGSIRRDPDLHLRLDEKKLTMYMELQRKVFDQALSKVKSGGTIFYVTCSLLKEENENQVEYFQNTYSDIELVSISEVVDSSLSKHLDLSTYFKIGPWYNGMDAFFGAIFRKK